MSDDVMVTHRLAAERAMREAVFYAYSCAVEGEIAEFGTMTGFTAQALSRAMKDYEVRKGHWITTYKHLYLFDSFEGLPKAQGIDKECPHVVDGVWHENSCQGMPPEVLEQACKRFIARVHIVKGWFNETISAHDKPLALIHVDSDLYQSAIDVLDPLFRKRLVSEGAMILFDDWNCNRASPEFGERRAWAEMVKKYNVEYSDEGGYGFMSHKFIVHSYAS